MPTKNIYKTLAAVLIVVAFLFIVFGSILPFIKSNRYPTFLRLSSSARTLEEFESYARDALDFKSPIGQEETVQEYIETQQLYCVGAS